MIGFNELTQTRYVKELCCALAIPVSRSKTAANLRPAGGFKIGRRPAYSKDVVTALEARVNEKMLLAESVLTSLGQRIALAKDLKGWSNFDIAKRIGVSREAVRCWLSGKNRPASLFALAKVLDVPALWLENGGEKHLPADSHLGRFVGDEMATFREALYGKTQALIAKLPDDFSETKTQQAIESAVFADSELARLARRSGGRWQYLEGDLRFAPWIEPLSLPDLKRRYWSDEVEVMIAEELEANISTYAAWHSLKARCIACGLPYPAKISLYKRLDKRRRLEEKHGIRFNLS
jgi:transcriptional regulator with XRE-family HTH domain